MTLQNQQPIIRSSKAIASLTGADPALRAQARYNWRLWARPNQLEPDGDWRSWLVLAGRGYGKTRTGVEWCRAQIESGKAKRIAVVAPTSADCRDTIVEGESGFLRCSPSWDCPEYEPSKRRLTWANGATVTLFSAEEPDRLRGPQFDAAYVDELAAWDKPETWDMLQFALRLGDNPRVVITTTPRPIQLIRNFLTDETCHVTRGTTLDNAPNLAPQFVDSIIKRYEGTRLYRQEIQGDILDDVADAILSSELIAELRVTEPPTLGRVVVGVDPAATAGDRADNTGIVVAGIGTDGDLYAIEDASCRLGPAGWARRVVDAYRKHGADLIVAEKNQGGLMVEHTIRSIDADVPIKLVTATRGKHVRAEPILSRFEQRRAHTTDGLNKLEEQLVAFTPAGYEGDRSPDSADAFIWAATELTEDRGPQIFVGM